MSQSLHPALNRPSPLAYRRTVRRQFEGVLKTILFLCSVVAVLTTVGIVLSLVFESLRFFATVSPFEFLFGLQWSPQTALRADQVGSSGAFGAVPVFAGTLLITVIAMIVAVPIGLMSAIYLAEYASASFRAWFKPILEILVGVPTVVYGSALTVGPVMRDIGSIIGLDVASESALAADCYGNNNTFVSSLSDDIFMPCPRHSETVPPRSVRQNLKRLNSWSFQLLFQALLSDFARREPDR